MTSSCDAGRVARLAALQNEGAKLRRNAVLEDRELEREIAVFEQAPAVRPALELRLATGFGVTAMLIVPAFGFVFRATERSERRQAQD